MINIGNYSNWIDNNWIEEIKSKDVTKELLKNIHLYDNTDLSFDLKNTPWLTKNFTWQFIKMYPGQFLLFDYSIKNNKNKNYLITITDHEPGHIFLYEDQLITNYKKGDIFCYEYPNNEYALANVGFSISIMLQITEL